MVQCNTCTMMAVTSKKARQERSRFTLQFEFSHKESQRLLYLRANRSFEGLFAGRKQHGMDGWSSYLQKEYIKRVFIHSVTVGFARNSSYGVFFSHLMSPIYVQLQMNARNSFRFRSSSISKVIWWNKRECVTVVVGYYFK